MTHESPLEEKLWKELTETADERGWRLQAQSPACDGTYRVDVAVFAGALKIACEVDGHEFHERTKEQARHDRTRDRDLQRDGWVVLRFTGREVHEDAGACVLEIAAVATALRGRVSVEVNEARVLSESQLLCSALLSNPGESGISTGNHELDAITGGIRPGYVWVVGAATSWGKSSFAVMLADQCLAQGKRPLIVTAEDPPELYGQRLLARRARVPASDLRTGMLSEAGRGLCASIAAAGGSDPICFDARGKPAEYVADRVRDLIRGGVSLVIYDYLQEFRSGRRQQDRRVEVSEVASALRSAVKSEGASGVILSQITEDREKAHPDKNSIRDSRDVPNAAEVVLLGFMPKTDVVKPSGEQLAWRGQRCLFVDKCKDGPRGALLPLDWDDRSACFDAKPDPMQAQYDDIAGDGFENGRW